LGYKAVAHAQYDLFYGPLFDGQDSHINAGHADAWYNSLTSGQGQLIDVVPEDQFMFLAWFTFTAGASNNPDQQHWYTAQGEYSGNTAELILHETLGGRFDDPMLPNTAKVGTMIIDFTDCSNAQLSYSLTADNLAGDMAISRLSPGGQALCEELSGTD
jgi:hypothetical protein